jgi:flavin reductase (DIM6/NTAB) family NADH-FMN oxidoreductase RutF
MDAQAKKVALRAINYGLFILTAADGDELGAGGVNWLSQASFAPPLVMVAVRADSNTHALIERAHAFAINVLAEDQLEIAKAFFGTSTIEGDLVNGYQFERGAHTGAPLILDLPYWFETRVTDTVKRGDHTIFVGEVVNAGVRDDSALPLSLRATGMNYGG